jgi:hypothetical protein
MRFVPLQQFVTIICVFWRYFRLRRIFQCRIQSYLSKDPKIIQKVKYLNCEVYSSIFTVINEVEFKPIEWRAHKKVFKTV